MSSSVRSGRTVSKLGAPLRVAARNGPAGGADLPHAQQPDPVEALFGKAVDRRVVDVGQGDAFAGLARQLIEPDARIDLKKGRIAWHIVLGDEGRYEMGGVSEAGDDAVGIALPLMVGRTPRRGTAFRENPQCCGKWHIDRVHSLGRQDVDRSSDRRRHRRHQHRKGTVLQFLDNQCRTSASSISARTGRECRVVRLTAVAMIVPYAVSISRPKAAPRPPCRKVSASSLPKMSIRPAMTPVQPV